MLSVSLVIVKAEEVSQLVAEERAPREDNRWFRLVEKRPRRWRLISGVKQGKHAQTMLVYSSRRLFRLLLGVSMSGDVSSERVVKGSPRPTTISGC